MGKEYLPIHTSAKSLSEDLNSLVDQYFKKEISMAELSQWLHTWEKNCPNFMFADEGHKEISKALLRYCGKRRTVVVMTVLTQNSLPTTEK